MPLYTYKGQSSASGKTVKGSIQAENLRDAKAKLRKQKIFILKLEEDSQARAAQADSTLWSKLTRKPPKPEDLALATKQFAILMNSAVDINESLRAIADQVENAELKAIYVRIRELVSEGKSLSAAHREFPKVFNSIYVNMIGAAEKSGALGVVLQRLSDFMYYQIEIKRKVVGALTYPALMVVMALVVVLYLFIKVMPQLTESFASLDVTLPWYTIWMNNISTAIQNWWIVTLIFILLSVVGVVYASKTEKGRQKIDSILFNLPIFGILIQKVAVSRFAKTLSTILTSGVRIIEALHLTRKVVGNSVMEDAIDEAIVKVQDGDKLAAALEKTGIFPTMVIHMLRTGEKTGKLEEMLKNIADIYDDDVDNQITITTRLIEPAMMIFMAVVVFMMVLAVIGPMMAAMQQLG